MKDVKVEWEKCWNGWGNGEHWQWIFFWERHKPLCVAQHSHIHHDVGTLYSTKEVSRKPLKCFWFPSPVWSIGSSGVLCAPVEEPRETDKLVNLQRPGIRTKQPPYVKTFWPRTSGWDKMASIAEQDQQLLVQRVAQISHTTAFAKEHKSYPVDQRSSLHSPFPSDTMSYKPYLSFSLHNTPVQ